MKKRVLSMVSRQGALQTRGLEHTVKAVHDPPRGNVPHLKVPTP